MSGYPAAISTVDHIEPVPRRIRAQLGGVTVLDTTAARYVWEWPYYPQYYVPLRDVLQGVLADDGHTEETPRGEARVQTMRAGGQVRSGAAKVYRASPLPELVDTVRFDWDALDAWYEEDEQVYVHPRSPYVRVDALRSTRPVRVELEGVLLAASSSAVMVFETGLPTRYYVNRTEIDLDALVPSETTSACPYKGVTSDYWSVRAGAKLHPDLAWSYAYPTRQLQPITGLVAFYNEKVDITVAGERLERPRTHFFAHEN